MSRRDPTTHRLLALLVVLTVSFGTGCWEQWSEAWFPQMKWQKAVQAYERVEFRGQIENFTPPEGTVPVGGVTPSFERFDPAADARTNPYSNDDWKALKRGQEVYETYCLVCHGVQGMGDGPVSITGAKQGPLVGIFPLVAATGRSDGYIFNIIRNGGGRMPAYRRIAEDDRWQLVTYVRYLQRGGQP